MHEDDRFAAFELIKKRFETLVSEVDPARVRKQYDAIKLQRIERIFEFAQRAIYIR